MSINISSEEDELSEELPLPLIGAAVTKSQQRPKDGDEVRDMMFDNMVSCLSSIGGSSSNGSSGYESGSFGAKRRKSIDRSEDQSIKKTAALQRAKKKKKLPEEQTSDFSEDEESPKLSAADIEKIYKPGECMKYMVIQVHPSLRSAWYLSDLARELDGSGVSIQPVEGLHEGLIIWSRRCEKRLVGHTGKLQLSSGQVDGEHGLLVLSAEAAAALVSSRALAQRVARSRPARGRLSLVVFGLKDYYKSKKKNDANAMTEIEFEMALTDLLVTADCDTAVVNTPNELSLLIVQFTKAIAEAPHKQMKRACDEQADFYMRGDNKKCVPVDKNGHGLSRLWQQMIAVLPSSSLETARAVCSNYKSPLALYEAMGDPNSVNELADIGVDRAGLPGTRFRRIGPEFARKLKTLFTADDGDMLLD